MVLLNKRASKALSITAFLLIIAALITIIITPSATGYEFSIYDAYPLYFWFLIIMSILSGSILIINTSLSNKKDNYWKLGFLAIIMANIILLILPIARNYFLLGRGDVLVHIGFMKGIIETGTVGNNFYPIIHILGVSTKFFSDIKFNEILILILIITYILFVSFSYLSYSELFKEDGRNLFVLLFSSILIFSSYNTLFAPFSLGFMLIPFFIYSYIKSRRSEYKIHFTIITLILAFLMTFIHPIITIFLVLIMLTIEFSNYVLFKKSSVQNIKERNSYIIISIMVIIFFSWQSYSYWLIRSIVAFTGFYTTGTGESQLQSYSAILDYGSPTLFQFIKFMMYKYGPWIIIGLLAIISIIYLLKKGKKVEYYILPSSGFLVFSLGSIITFISVYIIGFTRVYIVAIIFSIFLISYFFKIYLDNKNKSSSKVLRNGILGIILCLIIYFSIFNIYFSPLVKEPNEQITISEYAGTNTYYNTRDNNIRNIELGIWPGLFFDAIYGKTSNSKAIYNEKNIQTSYTEPVEHFGYTNSSSLSESYEKSTYLLINKIGRERYHNLNPEYKDKWKFNDDDFKKLSSDYAVQSIYQNGNLEIYLIK